MVFIAYTAGRAKATYSEFPRSLGMSAQFDIKTVVGASEPKCLCSKVMGALIEVGGCVEGGVELVQCV